MKIGQRLSALFVREIEGFVDLLVRCSVSILPSLKAEGCGEYGRHPKDHLWYKYVPFRSHICHRLSLQPVGVSCPYGPSNLTV